MLRLFSSLFIPGNYFAAIPSRASSALIILRILISVLKRRDLLPSGHRARPSIRPEILLLFQFLSAQSN